MSYTSPNGITADTVVDCLESHIEAQGFAPTMSELGDCLKLKSRSSVLYWLRQLEAEGRIVRTPGSARAIRIVR